MECCTEFSATRNSAFVCSVASLPYSGESMTLEELKEKLSEIEETALVDLLGITSEDIVEAFTDLIDEKFDKLEKEIE